MNFITQYRGLRKENYILFFGRIVTSLGGMIWSMTTMILNQKMGLSASGVAIIMLLFSLLMLPSTLIGGKLADTYNKKNVIIVCDLISVIFYIICAIIPLSYTTIVLIMIGAACQNMEYPSYNALIADISYTRDRERAYSLQYLGGNIGMVVAPTIAGFLFAHFLWLAFLISGLSILASTLLIFFKLKDITPVQEDEEASVYQENRSGESLKSIFSQNRILLLFILISGAFEAVYMQYGYLMPLDMGRLHGEQGAVIYGSVTSLNCIIVVICTPLITRIFHKMITTKKILTGQILVLVGYVVFLTMLGRIPFYYVAIAMFTFGEIFCTISSGPYLSSRIPSSHRGRINGVSVVVSSVFQSIFLLTTGGLYDSISYQAAWIFVFGCVAIIIAGTLALIVLDRRRYPEIYQ